LKEKVSFIVINLCSTINYKKIWFWYSIVLRLLRTAEVFCVCLSKYKLFFKNVIKQFLDFSICTKKKILIFFITIANKWKHLKVIIY
jgi:hypothetical protein